MTQHTPTPWMAERRPTQYPDLFTWSISQTHQHEGESHRYGIVSGIDCEHDAAHIVACVNQHDELVEQRDALLAALGESGDGVVMEITRALIASDIGRKSAKSRAAFLFGELERIREQARAAIAAARGTK